MDTQILEDKYCSVQEAAQLLGRARFTIYRWVWGDKIRYEKLGGVIFIPRQEIDRIKNEVAAV